MIRIEGSQHGRGIIIDARALEDPNLSFRAKGLLAYLQSLPRGRSSDVKSLERVSLEKKAAIETALKELVDGGYVSRIEEVGEGAKGTDKGVQSLSHGALMDSLFGELPRPGERPPVQEKRPAAAAKKDEAKRRVQRIIDHLNMLREKSWKWARYTPLTAGPAKNVDHIRGRLADGYSEDDLLLVLDYLAAEDGGKPSSRRYFNCVTPFRPRNFEENLTMARDWEARGRRVRGSTAERVIRRLNELRERSWDWARYTPFSPEKEENTAEIDARLSEGYSEEDLNLVLEYLAAFEGGKEESRKYYNCVTPFSGRNFERNLSEAREWDAEGRPQVGGGGAVSSLQAARGHDPEIYERRMKGGKK